MLVVRRVGSQDRNGSRVSHHAWINRCGERPGSAANSNKMLFDTLTPT